MLLSEKQSLLWSLNNGRNALETALAGVDDALASRKPPSGDWSILKCVEHMVLSEQYLLSRLRIAQLSNDPPHPSRETKIAARAADRSGPIEAPSMSQPSGQSPGLHEALDAFDAVRAETLEYLENLTDDPRCWITDHPLVRGPVTCQETLIMIAAHPARHAQQILEVRRALESADRRRWTSSSVVPGPVTYKTLRMIAAHPAHHAQQILEIREVLAREEWEKQILRPAYPMNDHDLTGP